MRLLLSRGRLIDQLYLFWARQVCSSSRRCSRQHPFGHVPAPSWAGNNNSSKGTFLLGIEHPRLRLAQQQGNAE